MTRIENYHSSGQTAIAQQARLTDWTWEGAAVVELRGTIGDLFPEVPVFSRNPYKSGGEENRFKDEIRREPLKLTERPIPVATVSKSYSLIQHREVLASVHQALGILDIDVSTVESSLLLSEYGERMHWSCTIPGVDFNPGDGHPIVLRINCLNSVDTSTSLEITFNWLRLVCSNGMMYGFQEKRMRRRHIQSLDPNEIAPYLSEQLEQIPRDKGLFRQWYATAADLGLVEMWLESIVADTWGPHATARVWNIITRGYDGEVEPAKNLRPLQLRVKETRAVPGSCSPAQNLFHVSQALSWIAGTRKTIPEQLEYLKAIPALMEPLVRESE